MDKYRLYYKLLIPHCRISSFHSKIGMIIHTYDGQLFDKKDFNSVLSNIDILIENMTWIRRNNIESGSSIKRELVNNGINIYNTGTSDKVTLHIGFIPNLKQNNYEK